MQIKPNVYEIKVVCSVDGVHNMLADLREENLLENLLKNGKGWCQSSEFCSQFSA